MAIEIVNFPIKYGGSFRSYVNVYQRVILAVCHWHRGSALGCRGILPSGTREAARTMWHKMMIPTQLRQLENHPKLVREKHLLKPFLRDFRPRTIVTETPNLQISQSHLKANCSFLALHGFGVREILLAFWRANSLGLRPSPSSGERGLAEVTEAEKKSSFFWWIYNGFIVDLLIQHGITWWFSIAFLNYQRVMSLDWFFRECLEDKPRSSWNKSMVSCRFALNDGKIEFDGHEVPKDWVVGFWMSKGWMVIHQMNIKNGEIINHVGKSTIHFIPGTWVKIL